MHKMDVKTILEDSKIVPIVALNDIEDAVPLAKALIAGGINVMEITLRTSIAYACIKKISQEVPAMYVSAGTVCTPLQFKEVVASGARFVFSPGISQALIDESNASGIPLIPGVATASEVMLAQNNAISLCKLFPAQQVGGTALLSALKGPFPTMKFCPTGGVNAENVQEYLALENVVCVGGTWIVPKALIAQKKFDEITKLAKR